MAHESCSTPSVVLRKHHRRDRPFPLPPDVVGDDPEHAVLGGGIAGEDAISSIVIRPLITSMEISGIEFGTVRAAFAQLLRRRLCLQWEPISGVVPRLNGCRLPVPNGFIAPSKPIFRKASPTSNCSRLRRPREAASLAKLARPHKESCYSQQRKWTWNFTRLEF